MNKIIKKSILSSLLGMGFIWSSQSFAVTCTIFANKVSEFESLTTFELQDKGALQKQFTSGLSCDGVALNTSTRTYLRYQTVSLSNELINSQTNDKIQIQYFGNDRSTPLSPTAPPVDISFTNGINVFEGTDKSVRSITQYQLVKSLHLVYIRFQSL